MDKTMFIQKCYLFLGCMASVCFVRAMQFDQLPADIVSEVVGQLIKNVGTPALKNKPDIPVIVNYVKALSWVNTNLYQKVNSRAVTHAFINVLAQRFAMIPINIIDKINTPGARGWINEYLQETNEYELFKVLHQIFTIADKIREEVKLFGLDVDSGKKRRPEPAHFSGQTKQGFFLKAVQIPYALYTPWGQIELFASYRGGGFT